MVALERFLFYQNTTAPIDVLGCVQARMLTAVQLTTLINMSCGGSEKSGHMVNGRSLVASALWVDDMLTLISYQERWVRARCRSSRVSARAPK